ncbi:hypothetical protein AVKW3434_06410 [Acidovorax sp. SUPP3434]|uniref:hypothetical protein n=1 Tax=Acidovorax sp. SUPP3434 TaxID=2920880 RepID=UPI0023DE2C7A|nr:hypothetical protein [Acidovorax sp. SUPP3434]GKS98992.1 hypothetical protein AVKW3434_06410 [Acidovorax sp. SUPP3434]
MKRIFAKINLFSNIEGGRSQPIPAVNFGCPVFFENIPELANHAYDCRLLMSEYGGSISPGDCAKSVPIIFLSQDEVLLYARVGTIFNLWEGKKIGVGEIVKIE